MTTKATFILLVLTSGCGYVKAQDSISKMYYPTGQLYRETPYAGGKMNGVSRAYYEDGMLLKEITYFEDRVTGVARFYTAE